MKGNKFELNQKIHFCILILMPVIFVTAQSVHAAATTDDTASKSRDQHKQEVNDRMRDIREQAEQAREIRLVDTDLKYARAKEEYEKAKQNKHDNANLIHATITYAIACRNVRYPEKASRLYEEAADAYLAMNPNSPAEPECRKDLWSHLGYLPANSLQSMYPRLLKISETKAAGTSTSEIDQALDKTVSEQGSMSSDYPFARIGDRTNAFDRADFWKTAIDIRSSVRGADSLDLEPLLRHYAAACEAKNFPEAEKTYLRLFQISNKDSSETQARVQLDMARMYLRNKMNDKAEAAYRKAFETAKQHMTQELAKQFLSLSSEHTHQSKSELSIQILNDLLSVGGDETIEALDGTLNELITGYINKFDLTKAQALLIKRLNASKTCSLDNNATHWRLKLSEVDLALGEEAESNRLFEQVKVTYALTNQNVDKLIEDRKKLIDALKSNKQAASH